MAKSSLHRNRKDHEDSSTSERIVAAATRLFATKGFDGTSTKEICEAAGVNIAAIHYHFETKELLHRFIIESYGDSRLRSIRSILEPPENADELRVRLRMFLEDAIEPFLQQPDVCKIVQSEIELLHARSEDVFRNTFLKRFDTLVDFLSHAQKRGLLSEGIEPWFAARSLYSQICHHTRSDNVYHKFYDVSLRQEAYRKTWVEQTLRAFLNGICK